MKLAKSMIKYVQRHPLVLKVLGSFLRAETKEKWESILDKLKRIAPQEFSFTKILRLCFEELDNAEKDILFHMAFLKGKDVDLIERKLEASGNLFGRKGIQGLMQKSLVSINGDGRVWMHDLIQEMAWEILHQESTKEPRKHSWSSTVTQAIYHVWRTNKEIGAVEGRYFDVSRIDYEELEPTLKILGKRFYPPKYWPSMIDPHNLAQLDMPSSQLKRLWNEIQDTSSSVRLFSYEGQWRRTRGRRSFNGLKMKGMTVSKDITYQELAERLYSYLMVDRSQYDLDMRFLVNSVVPLPPFEIENDEDVNFFIGESSGKDSLRYPLCITLVRKDI